MYVNVLTALEMCVNSTCILQEVCVQCVFHLTVTFSIANT